jgi:hypothetical protein
LAHTLPVHVHVQRQILKLSQDLENTMRVTWELADVDTSYWRYGPSFRSKCAILDRFDADKHNINPDEDLCTKNKECCKTLSNGETKGGAQGAQGAQGAKAQGTVCVSLCLQV